MWNYGSSIQERIDTGTDTEDDPLGAELEECGTCGAIGLPERVENHDCDDFRGRARRGL